MDARAICCANMTVDPPNTQALRIGILHRVEVVPWYFFLLFASGMSQASVLSGQVECDRPARVTRDALRVLPKHYV